MIVFDSSSKIKRRFKKSVVVVGNFDGLHLGHQALISKAKKRAERIGGTSIVYTFHPHPSRIVHPGSYQPQINTPGERLKLIQKLGVDVAVVELFNRAFSQKSAQAFFDDILVKNLKTKILFVGYNFFFGKDRQGDTETLKKLCQKKGIELYIARPFKIQKEVVSSSKIRASIGAGNVKKASAFLGRPFFLEGITIKGVGRGKMLGFPTANIKTKSELIPKAGVYLTLAEHQSRRLPSVTNIGHAPTFSQQTPFSIETHLIDFKKELYGEPLILHFIDRLRDTKKFPSPEALVKQIKKDIQKAKALVARLFEEKARSLIPKPRASRSRGISLKKSEE